MRSELARLRALLREALPPMAFVRRDRGEGLFITNAPAFDPDLRAIPGFRTERQGSLLRILPDGDFIARFEEEHALPPDALCRSLLRFRGEAISRDGLLLFARGLKLLDAGSAAEAEITEYERSVRMRAALALRGGCGAGALYGSAILLFMIQNDKGE